jgi:hypothetical protein
MDSFLYSIYPIGLECDKPNNPSSIQRPVSVLYYVVLVYLLEIATKIRMDLPKVKILDPRHGVVAVQLARGS